MSTENIIIQIREDGSRVVIRNINDIGGASRGAQSAIDSMKNALRGIAGLLALNELRRYADIWIQVQGKVNIFTHSAQETAQIMERLYQIAQDTRQPLAAVGNSFHQLSIAGASLGASQEQLLTFTKAIGNALAIQGTDANTARGGILQLGQAMNEGIVRAQEYNSMINAMPIVLKTVANNLEGVGGSLAKLRKRMLEGKLYSKDFFDALLRGAPELAALFDKAGKTIGQAFTVLENAMIKYVGQTDQAYGVSAKFYDAAKWGAENIDNIVKVLTSLAAPMILNGIIALGRAMWSMAAAAVANPYVTLAAAIVAVATAMTLYRNQIILVEQGQVSLGDYMKASWSEIKDVAQKAGEWIEKELPGVMELVRADWATSMEQIKTMWVGLVANINSMVGTFVGLGKAIGIALAAGLDPLKDSFLKAFNWIISKAQELGNSMISKINSALPDSAQIELINFDLLENKYEGSASNLADSIKGAFKESLGVDYVGDLLGAGGDALDKLGVKAAEFAKERHAAEAAANQQVDLNTPTGPGDDFTGKTNNKALNERIRLQKQLASVVSEAAPAEGALLKYQLALSVLTKAQEKGLITGDQYNKYLALVKYHFDEIANPMAIMNRDIDEQTQLLNLNVRQREIENQMLAARRELMQSGATVDEAELKRLRERYTELQKLNELVQAQDQILGNSVEKRRAFATQLEAIQKLLEDPTNGFSSSDAKSALFDMSPQLFEGTTRYVEQVKKSYQEMFDQINMMRQADLISEQEANNMRLGLTETLKQQIIQAEIEAAQARLAMNNGSWADMMLNSVSKVTAGFSTLQKGVSDSFGQMFQSLSDGFANSMAAAIVSGENFGESLKNVANQAVEMLISSLIKLGIQWAINAAMGQALGATTTAASIAMAGTTAAAWAPAASLVSLASFGGNSVPAMAGMTSTAALGEVISLSGMAHSGMDYIPEEGTWLLDKGERVVDSRTNADLKNYLAGGGSGSSPVASGNNVIQMNTYITNNASSDVAVRTEQGEDEDGTPRLEVYIDRIEESLAGRMGSGRGPLNRATADAFGLRSNARNGRS